MFVSATDLFFVMMFLEGLKIYICCVQVKKNYISLCSHRDFKITKEIFKFMHTCHQKQLMTSVCTVIPVGVFCNFHFRFTH